MNQYLECEIVAPRTYNDYSRERKAEVLALVKANGGNVLQTSRETGIHHATIQGWQQQEERFADLQHEVTIRLDNKLDNTVHRLIDSIHDHDLEKANLASKATAFGIVFDKLQLLRGQPTSINIDVNISDLGTIIQGALANAVLPTDDTDQT